MCYSCFGFRSFETFGGFVPALASSATTNSDCEGANLSEDDDNDKLLCEVKESVDYLASHFRLPLEAKGVVTECHSSG